MEERELEEEMEGERDQERASGWWTPEAGSIGTGVRGFGMRSADLKLRSEIPICAAISQPASGNGIISVRQGRASQSCFARTSSISWCSPGGEHLGGFRRPIWGQGYAGG